MPVCSYDESRNLKEYKNHYEIRPNLRTKNFDIKKVFEYNSKDNENFYDLKKIRNILNKSKLFKKKF